MCCQGCNAALFNQRQVSSPFHSCLRITSSLRISFSSLNDFYSSSGESVLSLLLSTHQAAADSPVTLPPHTITLLLPLAIGIPLATRTAATPGATVVYYPQLHYCFSVRKLHACAQQHVVLHAHVQQTRSVFDATMCSLTLSCRR
jgi:hypothetical protein